MNFARFLLCVIAGAALWVITLVSGGYFFGTIPFVRDHMSAIVLLGVTAGVGSLVVNGAWRFFISRKAG
jgi:membrane-associated protein